MVSEVGGKVKVGDLERGDKDGNRPLFQTASLFFSGGGKDA